ncbi:MAG: substrate-binding domain-containing protein [Kiritimatiellae bacterium]|nr:substrate-binding domain-containing protein [Kiritimatiellia bacterium]
MKARPVYLQIKRRLEEDIAGGKFADGDVLCRIADICERFRVSPMTSHQVVKALKADGFVTTRKGGGIYVANSGALHDRRRRENYILIYGHHFVSSPGTFFSFRNEALIEYFHGLGMGVRFLSAALGDTAALQDALVVDGPRGIVMDWSHYAELGAAKRRIGVPVVLYNSDDRRLVSANLDHPGFARLSAGFFAAHGVKTVALMLPRAGVGTKYDDRWVATFEKRFPGKVTAVLRVRTSETPDEGARMARELLRGNPPKGLFVTEDLAMGAILALQRAGVDIPEGMCLLALGSPVAESVFAALHVPVVGCDPRAVGRTAAQLLHRLIEGRKAPRGVTVIPPLISPHDPAAMARLFMDAPRTTVPAYNNRKVEKT